MGRQKGLFPVTGTLGGLNFYLRKGEPVVRVAGGGFNGKAIKTKPSMQRVRENGSEFGHCSKAKKVMRIGLQTFLGKYIDFNLHGRMVQLMTQLKDLDRVSERGKRNVAQGIETDEGKKLLLKFDYTPRFKPYYYPSKNTFDIDSFTVTLSGFQSIKEHFPKDANQLKIEAGLMTPDFSSMQVKMEVSEKVFIEKESTETDYSLRFTTLPTFTGWGFVFLHLQFMKQNGDKMEEIPGEKWNGVRLVSVFKKE